LGLDTDNSGELDEDEVDDSLTKYLCNGNDGVGGSGTGNFTGDNLVPEDIVILNNRSDVDPTGSTTQPSYVVPDGKYAKISAILFHNVIDQGLSGDIFLFGGNPNSININGETVFLGGNIPTQGTQKQMFKSHLFFPQGTEINIPDEGSTLYLFVEEHSLNNFIPKIISDQQTVPVGKKWKVTNFFSNTAFTEKKGNSILINDAIIYTNGGDFNNSQPSQWDTVSLTNDAFWIPEGTTLAPGINTYAVNVLEFDSSQSSASNGEGFSVGASGGFFNSREVISYPLTGEYTSIENWISSAGSGYANSTSVSTPWSSETATIPSSKTFVVPNLNSSKIEIKLPTGNNAECSPNFSVNVTVSFFDSNGEPINSSGGFNSGVIGSNISFAPLTTDYFNSGLSHSFTYGQDGGFYNCTYDVDYHTREAVFYLPENADSVEITFYGNPVTSFNYITEASYLTAPSPPYSQNVYFYSFNKSLVFDLVVWR